MKPQARFVRSLSVGALFALGVTGAMADASWDIDACSGGSKSSSGYTSCGSTVTNGTASGVTLDVKALIDEQRHRQFRTCIDQQSDVLHWRAERY